MLGKPRILSLSPTCLIKSIKHEHLCKIHYFCCGFLCFLSIPRGDIGSRTVVGDYATSVLYILYLLSVRTHAEFGIEIFKIDFVIEI